MKFAFFYVRTLIDLFLPKFLFDTMLLFFRLIEHSMSHLNSHLDDSKLID